jgi:hypothetical protein
MCWFCNSKSECERLKAEKKSLETSISMLCGELKEANACYNYQVAALEQEIDGLKHQEEVKPKIINIDYTAKPAYHPQWQGDLLKTRPAVLPDSWTVSARAKKSKRGRPRKSKED